MRLGLALATSQRKGQHDTGLGYSLCRRFYRDPNTGTRSDVREDDVEMGHEAL